MGSKITTTHTFRIAARDLVKIQHAWELFVSGGQIDLRDIPPVIQASWLRSRQKGIDPALACAPFEELPASSQELHQQAPWLSAAEPVFRLLQSVFTEPHHLLLLGDDNGHILLSHGGSKALTRAEDLHAVAGGKWSEAEVGCTAIGASLQSGLAVQVNWFETYCRNWHDWVNQAAPIHDPVTHHILGALNVAGFREISHPGTLNVILQAVSLIEMAVLEQETRLRMAVLEQFNTLSARYHTDGVIACDRRGYILAINPTAEKQLALPRMKAVGQRIDTVRPLLDLLGPNASHLLDVPPPEQVLQQAVVVPVMVDHPAGAVVILPVPAVKQSDSLWTTKYTFADLIGEHPRFRECADLAFKASRQDWPLLILGESGTGKELFAHAIHNAGPRRHAPFVVFACAGISEELIGAELFGYTDGSFTGAARGGSVGKIQLADKGTLFLDDIDCMPPKMQASLLRVLEDQRVLPLGGTKPQPVDVRVIASSNADLERASSEGRFRHDLYYRLNVLSLTVPPLSARPSDIPLLVAHLLSQIASGTTITDEALALLSAYKWPGNVRELRNVLIRASVRAQHQEIGLNDLPEHLLQPRDLPAEPGGDPVAIRPLETSEREEILNALRESETVLQAADKLGIHFTTLYRKLKKLGLSMSQAEPGVFGSGKSRLSSTKRQA